jgi:tryptophan synthase beta chain
MYTLGHNFMPAPIHAGGLRYHGMSPLLSGLVNAGYIQAMAVPQLATFEAALIFANTEAIIPAPESAHVIRAAIDEALDAKKKGEKRVILFNLSGHGFFDMTSYQAYLAGKLEDYEYPAEAIHEAMKDLPAVPAM